jgi:linearmycin/streptolysin S transport system permease protein
VRALAVARASTRRIIRDRRALFFLLVLPVVVIVIIGATARGFSTFRVGVYSVARDAASARMVTALDHSRAIDVVIFHDRASLTTALARGEISVGVMLPADLGARESGARPATVTLFAEQVNSTQQAAATAVDAVILGQGALVQAANFAVAHSASSFEHALARASTLQRTSPGVGLRAVSADSRASTLPQGYSYSAPTEMVLFVFLSALAGGAAIIETRRLGMYERMLAGPVRAHTIIAGEAMTYFLLALVQSALIIVVGAVAFGVSWGNPLAAGLLVVIWALVGAGAGLLSGTLFRSPEQASAIGPTAGIALAMLGGCMWPLSIVSTSMREFGHITPQAWAVDAWTSLLSRHGTTASIAPQLGVLVLFAVALLSVSSMRMYRRLR